MKMSMEKGFYEQLGVAMTCRSFREYEAMFALSPGELHGKRVLDTAAGASSFSAAARARGIQALAVDPLYDLSYEKLAEWGKRELEEAEAKIVKLEGTFDWSFYGSPGEHQRMREHSLTLFLQDYLEQQDRGMYVAGSLPVLPLADACMDLVLCSHFLFLYGESFSYEFHRDALLELVRVCRPGGEIRVYPLLDLKWRLYPHMEQLLDELYKAGMRAEFIESRLPFIPGSNRLLRLQKT